jgi:putative ABC transport system ATP-binding protein
MALRPASNASASDSLSIQVAGLEFQHAAGTQEGPSFQLRIPALDIPAGASLVCTGPSGCGKSTLLQLLAGILVPDQGIIRLGGEDLATKTPAERRNWRISNIGLVFQEFELLEHLTVRENVLLPYFVNRDLTLDDRAESTLQDLASRLGISPYLRRKPQRLSQGERQRVALCRALINQPRLLFADEPTGNLDPENTTVVLDLLMEEVGRRNTTLVVVTHDHSLLPRFDQLLDFRNMQSKAVEKTL